jgi:hypothetical protein
VPDRDDPGADLVRSLRKAYREIQRGGSAGCPEPERLADLLLGGIEQADREKLADHVVACRNCAAVMNDLLALHEEAGPEALPGAGAPVRRRAGGTPWVWRLAGIAAVVTIGVALAVWQWGGGAVPPRGGDRGIPAVKPPVQPPDRATLDSPPARLSWAAMPGADRYQVVLMDFESTPVWESPIVADTSVDLPEPVRSAMLAGGRYYWRVSALTGVERRRSDLHEFTLSP